MKIQASLLNLGFSQYEITAYLGLVGKHPVNGSQLSRSSGIPRARIYDVLRSLREKGLAAESGDGLYAPLPPDELFKRLRHKFETDLADLEAKIKTATGPGNDDYVWSIRGYRAVLAKAGEMIASAREEIYVRLFPPEGRALSTDLQEASARGIEIKSISMGAPPTPFRIQVVHPDADRIEAQLGGRSFDLVVDRKEILVGMLETGREDLSSINWARNHWFVVATRDSLRHDFFHYFLHKLLDERQPLTAEEEKLYHQIAHDV